MKEYSEISGALLAQFLSRPEEKSVSGNGACHP